MVCSRKINALSVDKAWKMISLLYLPPLSPWMPYQTHHYGVELHVRKDLPLSALVAPNCSDEPTHKHTSTHQDIRTPEQNTKTPKHQNIKITTHSSQIARPKTQDPRSEDPKTFFSLLSLSSLLPPSNLHSSTLPHSFLAHADEALVHCRTLEPLQAE